MVLSPTSNFMDSSLGTISACQLQPRGTTCTIEEGIDYFGNDLVMHPNTQTVDDCCSLCKANSACMAFSWANESDPQYAYDCWLKTSTAGRRPESHTSGYLCDDTGTTWLVAGVQGQIETVPAGYSQSFILSPLEGEGVTAAMYKWGDALRAMHNTTRLTPDTVSTKIGYATDNGGYWYGRHVPTADNLTAVVASIRAQNISLGSLQLDPFWYHNGDLNTDNCALSWQARKDLFPNGLVPFRKDIGDIPLILYSSLWCSTTQFVPDFASHGFRFVNSTWFNAGFDKGIFAQADPATAEAFYDYILTEHATEIAGGGFETDFMDFSALLVPEFNTQLGSAAGWLKGMWGAAAKHGLPSQQCMSLPSMILNALDHPAVTNARASEDDFPTNPNRWQIGYTGLFLGPVAIRPFFDVLWTQAVQPGNPYGLHRRSNVELEVAVATLSMGPVWIGDGAGFTNKTLVDRFATANGTLMHPSRPATPVDAMYSSAAPQGAEIWSTLTLAPAASGLNASSHLVLLVDVAEQFQLPLASLWPFSPRSPAAADRGAWLPGEDGRGMPRRAAGRAVATTGGWFASSYNRPCAQGMQASACLAYMAADDDTLAVQSGALNSTTGDHSWDLLTLVPELGPGFAFLGLQDTLVRASPQRVVALDVTNSNILVTVAGSPGERVQAAFLVPTLSPPQPAKAGAGFVVWRSDVVPASGSVVLAAVVA